MRCSGNCIDVTTDPANCGYCGHVCPLVNPPSNVFTPTSTAGAGFCSGGQCLIACAPGVAQCGNACVVTQTDAANCGGCGIQCAPGGVCFRGGCSPPIVSTQIATGLTDPLDIAVDGDSVYWTDPTAQTVNRMPKGGGAIQALASGQAKPTHLAMDSTYVYWTANLGNAIWRARKDGSAAASLFAPAYSPYGIAVAGGFVYWTNTAATGPVYTVERMPTAGGTPEVVTSNLDSLLWMDMASNGTVVLVAGNGAARVDGTAVVRLSGASLFNFVATDATSYYVCSGTNTHVTDRYDYNNTRIAVLGGALSSPGIGEGVAIMNSGAGDSCALYVLGIVDGVGPINEGLFMVPHHGPQALLVPMSTETARRVATDGDYVYWTDSTGFIARVAIP
jgi:hypothetical protein